jgi:hypothetical protein
LFCLYFSNGQKRKGALYSNSYIRDSLGYDTVNPPDKAYAPDKHHSFYSSISNDSESYVKCQKDNTNAPPRGESIVVSRYNQAQNRINGLPKDSVIYYNDRYQKRLNDDDINNAEMKRKAESKRKNRQGYNA